MIIAPSIPPHFPSNSPHTFPSTIQTYFSHHLDTLLHASFIQCLNNLKVACHHIAVCSICLHGVIAVLADILAVERVTVKVSIFCSHMSGIYLQVMSACLKQFCYALSFGCAIITDKQKILMHL